MRHFRAVILLLCVACSINNKKNGVDGGGLDINPEDPGTVTVGVTGEIGTNGNNTFPSGPSLSPDSSYVRYIGRVEPGAPGGIRLAWPGAGLKVRLTGASSLTVTAQPNQYGENNIMGAYVDGALVQTYPVQGADVTIPTVKFTVKIPTGDHVVTLIKRTEAGNGMVLISNLTTDGQFEQIADGDRLIEVIGENAAAGYSADSQTGDTNCAQPINSVANPIQQDAAATFGALTAKAFNARASSLAFSGRGLVQNFDGSVGMNMADLYDRINPMDFSSTISKTIGANAVVINLGANDINYWMKNKLGAAADPAGYTAGMVALIKKVRTLNPDAAIIVTIGPSLSDYQCIGGNPNSGYSCASATNGQKILTLLRDATKAAITQVADSKVSFLEFPADTTNVGACYLPSAQGHAIMANLLIPAVAQATGWTVGSGAVAQAAAAPAGKGQKTLTGTFAPRPDPLVVGGADPNSGITNKEFPQCHYCSPTSFNPNAVGTAQCPTLVGVQQPCQSYCHVPDGFVELYGNNPPTAGNHYATPQLVTLNSTAVPRGKWIHSMEHGTVVFTYNCPEGCADSVALMKSLYDKYAFTDPTKASAWVIVTPDPQLTASKFAVSSWTWSLNFDTFGSAEQQTADCFIQQHAFYGRECPNDGSSSNPRACPNLSDHPMSTVGG